MKHISRPPPLPVDEVWTVPVEYTGNDASSRTFTLGYQPLAVILGCYIGGNFAYYLEIVGITAITVIPGFPVNLSDPNNILRQFKVSPLACAEFYYTGTINTSYPNAVVITSTGFQVNNGTSGVAGNWGTNKSTSKYCYWCRTK